jgi:hypothetical protein
MTLLTEHQDSNRNFSNSKKYLEEMLTNKIRATVSLGEGLGSIVSIIAEIQTLRRQARKVDL